MTNRGGGVSTSNSRYTSCSYHPPPPAEPRRYLLVDTDNRNLGVPPKDVAVSAKALQGVHLWADSRISRLDESTRDCGAALDRRVGRMRRRLDHIPLGHGQSQVGLQCLVLKALFIPEGYC